MVRGGQAVAPHLSYRKVRGGKSELQRVGRSLTERRLTESATETIPPCTWCRVRVKRCGKSAPRGGATLPWGKPRPEQNQIRGRIDPVRYYPWVGRLNPTVMWGPDR